jgi:hypothetical protein
MKCAAVTKPSRRGCWRLPICLSVLEDETALPHGEIENRARAQMSRLVLSAPARPVGRRTGLNSKKPAAPAVRERWR